MTTAELELDLDVFSGPFDLLMALVLRARRYEAFNRAAGLREKDAQ